MNLYEITAAMLALSHLVLAAIAMGLCVFLFRRSRNYGWLLLGVLFIQPWYFVAMRLAHGRPALAYRVVGGVTEGGAMQVTYRYDLPTLYVCAVVGLFLLACRARRPDTEGVEPNSAANSRPAGDCG
jgi:hypothetical protein